MKHGKVWAAILAILGAIGAFIFGKRSSVRNNGSGIDSIRRGFDDIQNGAVRITVRTIDTQKSVDNITKRIDEASIGIDSALGIVQGVRDRGAKKADVASD